MMRRRGTEGDRTECFSGTVYSSFKGGLCDSRVVGRRGSTVGLLIERGEKALVTLVGRWSSGRRRGS